MPRGSDDRAPYIFHDEIKHEKIILFGVFFLSSVWNSENIRKRKIYIKKNYFLMVGFNVKNIEENKI